MNCSYCSDSAVGYDEDDAPTCGDAAICSAAVRPLGIVEVSSDSDDSETATGARAGKVQS